MSKFIEDHEIKDGTMCWIGQDSTWFDVVVFQKVGSEIRAWFRQLRLTAKEFRDRDYAISPIPYPVYSPMEMLSKEAKWDEEGK